MVDLLLSKVFVVLEDDRLLINFTSYLFFLSSQVSVAWKFIAESCVRFIRNTSTYLHIKSSINRFINIERLDCWKSTNLEDNDVIYLTNLTYLDIWCTDAVTNHALSRLVNLNHLSLEENDSISDEGLKRLTNLRSLRLSCSQITDAGISHLVHLTRP